MALDDLNWFSEDWAKKLQKHARALARLYYEACAAAWCAPHPYQTIHPGGLWGGRPLWVIGWFVRDAVIRHIQINLRQISYIHHLAEMVSHPTWGETRLPIKETAPEERVLAAREEQKKKEEKRNAIAFSLNAAIADFRALEKLVSGYKSTSNQIIGFFVGLIKNLSPIAFLVWVFNRFRDVAGMPLWQGILLCLLWILSYNILGLLGIPFHDANYRKYLLFEGYLGTPDDGIKPLFPPVSRAETEFYEHLGVARPIVISWDDLLPPLHYIVTILMIVASLYFLPLGKQVLTVGIIIGGVLIVANFRRLLLWHFLMKQRYAKPVPALIANAFLLSISGPTRGSGEDAS